MTAPGARPPAATRLPPEPPLTDGVIVLRLPRTSDAAAVVAACNDPEIARWIPVPVPYSLDDALDFIGGASGGWATGAELTFAIEDWASGVMVGMIGLHRAGARGRASIGYWLAPGARSQGLATRAVRLITTWAFEDPALERLELMTLVGNDASGRVALRAGFRREGILRRYLPFRESLVDAVMYAMVRDGEVDDGNGVADDPLAGVSLFADLGPAELARVRSVATEVSLAPGAILITEGDPGDALFVLLEGTLAVSRRAGSGEVSLTTVGPGAVQGEIAVLEGGLRRATVRAATPARLVRIGRDDLFDVLAREPAVLRSLVGTVARRLRDLESSAQEQERLASLGTLAAGLAHELNNPAAAARSSVGQLEAALDEWDRATTAVGMLTAGGGPAAEPVAAELLDTLREEAARRAGASPTLDPLDAADRRDAVATLLATLGMAAPHEPAAALVALGWDGNEIDDLLAPFGDDEARLVVATWLAATALARQLLTEVAIATERISEVIGAVREYTYLDRAPVQRVAVAAGLENTLVILRSRWKAGVTVRRSYAPDLPVIDAYGSELNQVWTNLIANAIDAMGGTGELTITAIPAPVADGVVVEIRDSGPGIAEDVRKRIFDPFFTTKDLGAGTGLGLHISRSIVERHGGHLELASGDPGQTTFRVTLPAHLPPATAATGSSPEDPSAVG